MEGIKCPSCGSTDLEQISASKLRCEHCRTILMISTPSPSNSFDDELPCPHCGTPNQADEETCDFCQGKLPVKSEIEEKNTLVTEVIYHPGGRDMDLVKVVRWLKNHFQLSLNQAKTLSAGSCTLAREVPLSLAEMIRDNFNTWGAKVEINLGQE